MAAKIYTTFKARAQDTPPTNVSALRDLIIDMAEQLDMNTDHIQTQIDNAAPPPDDAENTEE